MLCCMMLTDGQWCLPGGRICRLVRTVSCARCGTPLLLQMVLHLYVCLGLRLPLLPACPPDCCSMSGSLTKNYLFEEAIKARSGAGNGWGVGTHGPVAGRLLCNTAKAQGDAALQCSIVRKCCRATGACCSRASATGACLCWHWPRLPAYLPAAPAQRPAPMLAKTSLSNFCCPTPTPQPRPAPHLVVP